MTESALLTAAERGVLDAVCQTFCPSLESEPGDDATLFALGATDVRLSAAVQESLATLSERQRKELRRFLRLLDSRAFMMLAARMPAGFASLNAAQREAALLALAGSHVPQFRSGYQALKRLATFLFYAIVDESGRNPTWPALSYRVPSPAPASS
ncbi:MAG: gluconate 2-dehydrogenase subunit 3 family protein, partial [Gemmatimonadaceae bacterium]